MKPKRTNKDYLVLKWGTLKGWRFHTKKAEKLLNEYVSLGHSPSVALQEDTPRQKEIICKLIDIGDFDKVYLDWSGKYVSKEKAKEYVLNYGRKSK